MRYGWIGAALALLLIALPGRAAVVVEGQAVDAEIHPGGKLLRYAPIFAALGIMHAYDPAQRRLRALRPYDNARFELVLPEGIVRANGQVLGSIPSASDERPEEGWLSPNAIAILTGTHAAPIDGGWSFRLDERLRPDTNLELWVNGSRIVSVQRPLAAGTTLLLPLRPIVAALGSTVSIEGATVSVTRIQDGAVLSWNSQSGVITANRRPVGVVAPSALTELAGLVLPRDAVAALTGTNISIMPGTSRVDVTLDDRLAGTILPSASVIDRARGAPFQVERARFQFGTLGTNFVDVRAHQGIYNARLLVEAPAKGSVLGDLSPTSSLEIDPLKPNWIALEWQSLEGGSGVIGDVAGTRRELDSVNVSRWRGITYQGLAAAGTYRLIAGTPIASLGGEGSAFNPTFEGEVLGARWYSDRGELEGGVAAARGRPGGQPDRVAANVVHTGNFKAGEARVWTHTDLSAGRTSTVEGREWGARLRQTGAAAIGDVWNLGGSIQYESEFFNPVAPVIAGETTALGVDRGSMDAYASYRLADNFSVGARLFGNRVGFDERQAQSLGGSSQVTYAWRPQQLTFTGEVSTARSEASGGILAGSVSVDRLSLTLDRNLSGIGLISSRYDDTRSRGAFQQRVRLLSVNASPSPLIWSGSRGQAASLSPFLGGTWSRSEFLGNRTANQSLNGSINATYDSGVALGEKWRITANAGYSAGSSRTQATGPSAFIDALLAGAPVPDRTVTDSTSGAYFDIRSLHRLTQAIWLEWGVNKQQGADTTAFVIMRGQFDVGARRAAVLPKPTRGQVQGRVFLDLNGNAKRDDDETGLAFVLVRFDGTPWVVRTDGLGNFTVNNLPQGAYTVSVDPTSLPLGLRGPGSMRARISVLDQQVTEVTLPIIRAGQVRGRAFVDLNGDGKADSDEDGPAGLVVLLVGEGGSFEATTTNFGQFVFDELPFGQYRLRVEGRDRAVEVTADKPFAVVDIPTPPPAEGRRERGRNGKRKTAGIDR